MKVTPELLKGLELNIFTELLAACGLFVNTVLCLWAALGPKNFYPNLSFSGKVLMQSVSES